MSKSVPKPDGTSPNLLGDWLAVQYPLAKKTTLRRMVEAGRVRVNGIRAVSFKQPLTAKDRPEVTDVVKKTVHVPKPKSLPFKIVHEDSEILVIDKPAGLLTATTPRETRPTAWALVRDYIKPREPAARIGLIHRLDRDASGLLVFSKNTQAFDSLKRQFFDHTVSRVYTVIVVGEVKPKADRIEAQLIEMADGTVKSTRGAGKGEMAITHYQTISSFHNRTMLSVKLETGRKHQIRVAMSERGWPVVNDERYGRKKVGGRLMLAATSLSLTHPRTGERLHFSILIPKEFLVVVPDVAPDHENPWNDAVNS